MYLLAAKESIKRSDYLQLNVAYYSQGTDVLSV